MGDLLSTAIHAHGGLSRWREISSLEGTVAVRGVGARTEDPGWVMAVLASTHLPLICLEDLGATGTICSFSHEEMRLYGSQGNLVEWASQQETRVGRPRRNTLAVEDIFRSSPALWAALNAPFLFTWPGFVTREIQGIKNADCGRLRRLLVGFPPGLGEDAHAAIVSFDNEGLMRDIRYAAHSGLVLPPACCTMNYVAHDGIVVGSQQCIEMKLPNSDGTFEHFALSLDIKKLRFW